MPREVIEAILNSVLKAPLIRYTYTKVAIRIIETKEEYKVYIDIGCSRPLVNKEWLERHLSTIVDKSKSTVVKGLRARIKLEGLATFNIYIPRIINNRKALKKV
jgi:hypothetical protein